MNAFRAMRFLPQTRLRGFVRRFVALFVILVCSRGVLAQSALSATNSPAQQATTQTAAPTDEFGSISGHIFRADTGGPLAKAIVTLDKASVYPNDRQVRRTGPDGAYKFDVLDAGAYQLTATAVGFAPAAYLQGQTKPFIAPNQESVHIVGGQSLSNIDLSLPSCTPPQCRPLAPDQSIRPVPKNGWSISGTVVGEDGEPLDAEVQAVGDRVGPINQEAVTNGQGQFRIVGTESESVRIAIVAVAENGAAYTLMYYPVGFSLDAAKAFSVSAGSAVTGLRIVFKRVPVFTISGKILPRAGTAKQRYAIRLRNTDADQVRFWPTTDGFYVVRLDGTFTIRGLQPGDYTLSVNTASRETLGGTVYYSDFFVRSGLAVKEIRVTDSDAYVEIPINMPTP